MRVRWSDLVLLTLLAWPAVGLTQAQMGTCNSEHLISKKERELIAKNPRPWPITKVDIRFGAGPDEEYSLEEMKANGMPAFSPATKVIGECFMEFVIAKMRAWQFGPPNGLKSGKNADGEDAYFVFIGPHDNFNNAAPAIAVTERFRDGSQLMHLNPADQGLFGEGTLKQFTAWGLNTMAHEFYHSVVNATPFRGQNTVFRENDWINEGTARAFGSDLARSFYGKIGVVERGSTKIPERSLVKTWLGERPYNEPMSINQRDEEEAKDWVYETSSFWSFLAETAYANREGRALPPPAKIVLDNGIYPVDYTYLAKLWERETALWTDDGELNWFEDALNSKDSEVRRALGHQNADRLIALFLSVISGLAPARPGQISAAAKQALPRYWAGTVFGGCEQVSFTEGRPAIRLLEIERLAGRCFDVSNTRDLTCTMLVQIPTDEDLIKQLWIGVEGGRRLKKTGPLTNELIDDAKVGYWLFEDVQPRSNVRIIVSNVNARLSDTDPVEARVLFSKSACQSPAQGARESKENADRHDEAEQRMRDGANAASFDQSTTKRLDWASDRKSMEIVIDPDSSEPGLMLATQGSGGQLDQVLTSAEALRRTNVDIQAGLSHRAAGGGSRTAEETSIRLSGIDYGFTGEIRDAVIISSRGSDDYASAINPEDALPGRGTRFEPNGRVVIEEFSPYHLSGRYEAVLVPSGQLTDELRRQSRPKLKVGRKISGRFDVPAPWMADPQYTMQDVEMDSYAEGDLSWWMTDRMAEDSAPTQTVPNGPNGPSVSTAGPASNSSSTGSPACDCTCSAMKALERTFAELDEVGRMPTPAESNIFMCASVCAARYAACN